MKVITVPTNSNLHTTDEELSKRFYYGSRTIWAICHDASKHVLCFLARPVTSNLSGDLKTYYDGIRLDGSWDTAMLKGIDHYELHTNDGEQRSDKYIEDRLDTKWAKTKSKQMYHVSAGFYHSWLFSERIDAS